METDNCQISAIIHLENGDDRLKQKHQTLVSSWLDQLKGWNQTRFISKSCSRTYHNFGYLQRDFESSFISVPYLKIYLKYLVNRDKQL